MTWWFNISGEFLFHHLPRPILQKDAPPTFTMISAPIFRPLLRASLALALFGLTACSAPAPEQQSQSAEQTATEAPTKATTSTLARVNVGAEPPSIDPGLVYDIPGYHIVHHLFEPLVRMDDKGFPADGAALSWTHNDDYTVWTFKLREGMTWSNGDPVTAQDWVYGITRVCTPDFASRAAVTVYAFLKNGTGFFKGELKEGETLGVKALDSLTLEITLENPTPFFISNLAHSGWYPMHQANVEAHPDWASSPTNYISNGPFTLSEVRPKDRVVMKRNPNFWDAKNVKLEQIEFLFINEQNSELSSFLSKELDMTGQVSNREAPNWVGKPEFYKAPAIGIYFVSFNTTKEPFTDVNFRRALSYSIHRENIVNTITQRGERPATGFIPHGIPLSDGREYRDMAPNFLNPTDFAGNLEKARKFLADSPIAKDKLPSPTYIYNNEDQLHKDIALRLNSDWKRAFGFEFDLQTMEWKVLLGRVRNLDHQFSRAAWFGDYMDPLTFLEIFETGHGSNTTGYSNPKYDDLLQQIRRETDVDKRVALIIEAERLIVEEDCVVAPIFEYLTPILVQTNFKNFVRTPLAGLDITRAYKE
ncbi:MAG: peptide ABC transporter substrate-binding protein [Candidatus Sumerlaeia bacterium]|nr:peptide ABC transporter substrate-binding protein [Candidatus Sumerlaeia bacterium]